MWKWTSLGTLALAGSLYVGCAARNGGVSAALLAALPRAQAESQSSQSTKSLGMDGTFAKIVGFGYVDVDGGTVALNPAVAGPVDEISVKEGEHVVAGQTLLQLHSEPARYQLSQAEIAVQQARIQLMQTLRAPSVHELLLRQQDQAVAVADARVLGQKRQIERLEKLSNSAAVAPENLSSAQDRGRELEAALTAEKLKLDHLKLENPKETIDLARANHTAAEIAAARAKDHLRLHSLAAAEAGTILRITVGKGQIAGPTSPVPAIWFCPDRKHVVRCEIDQDFADGIRPGLTAEIAIDGASPKRYRGTVERCSDWIAMKRSLVDEPFQKNDVRTLECIVAFESNPSLPAIRIGQKVRVTLTDSAGRNDAANKTLPMVQATGTKL